jgi:hypothetical protein
MKKLTGIDLTCTRVKYIIGHDMCHYLLVLKNLTNEVIE